MNIRDEQLAAEIMTVVMLATEANNQDRFVLKFIAKVLNQHFKELGFELTSKVIEKYILEEKE